MSDITRDAWIAVEDTAVALGLRATDQQVSDAAVDIGARFGLSAEIVANLLGGQFALMEGSDYDDDARAERLNYAIAVEQVDPDDDPVKKRILGDLDLPLRRPRR
mgnify:FL=1